MADVLGEDVDLAVVAVEDRSERAPEADGVELAVVTDEDDLGAGDVGGGEEPEHGGVVGHPGFVEDDDVAGGEIEAAVVQAPEQRGQGSASGDASLAAEGSGSLP